MPFVSGFKPPLIAPETALWFLFYQQKLLVKNPDEEDLVLQSQDLAALEPPPTERHYLGMLDGRPCYTAELPDSTVIPDAFALIGLRTLFGRIGDDMIRAVGTASHLAYWDQKHKYCGTCGHLTENKADERAKICTRCGSISYPRLSPAIIVAVLKDNQILLANSHRFPSKFYSVLAGFVEPGETLEECVQREVREEVGVGVKNIRYFGSQPWPFPDSLMIGFTAEYAGGEIRIEGNEIADADWFSAERLPPIPSRISIARHLIDWFLDLHGK